MSREWTMKSFKSGNSVALRVPVTVGILPGQQWRLVEDGDDFRLRRIDAPKRKIKGDWIGSMPWLEPLTREEREFDPSSRPWDEAGWPDWNPGKS